ncbi:DUF4936 family protein [uncultured Oxalicibacterium sp.]|uniref:DUF4936 family protein n=1 Tax=uncultured Oxalicibacterium sp. TaxID=1168540 RepID=UPI0025E42C88|nr:DUF4936 family protein [uncultured Oxalicibacterium sp.]
MLIDLYIYYRVREDDAPHLVARVQRMQTELRQNLNVTTSLKRRPLAEDGLQTWMEIYSATSADFQTTLDATAAKHDVLSLIQGKRHVEQFVDVLSCA